MISPAKKPPCGKWSDPATVEGKGELTKMGWMPIMSVWKAEIKTKRTVIVIIMADGLPASRLPDFFAIQR